MEIIFIFIWLLMMYAGYSMAESRGRSKLGWTIASFFFGVFALIALAIAGKTREKRMQDMIEMRQQMKDLE